jgi:CheY-like chemotaxis protein
MIARVLGEEGYAAETAEMGSSGLTRGLSEQFDLLIVDWMLPDLDGIQVVRVLRSAEVNVPILMLTARTQIEDRVGGLDAGPSIMSTAGAPIRVRLLCMGQNSAAQEGDLSEGECVGREAVAPGTLLYLPQLSSGWWRIIRPRKETADGWSRVGEDGAKGTTRYSVTVVVTLGRWYCCRVVSCQ